MGTPLKVSRGDDTLLLCCPGCLPKVQAEPDSVLQQDTHLRPADEVGSGGDRGAENVSGERTTARRDGRSDQGSPGGSIRLPLLPELRQDREGGTGEIPRQDDRQ